MRVQFSKASKTEAYAQLDEEAAPAGGNGSTPAWLGGAEVRLAQNAIIIQRHYRRMRTVYGELGPFNFMRHSGQPSEFGTVLFAHNPRAAPFIVVADTTPAPLLGHFIEKYWQLSRPEVIISVTGGAQAFALSPAVRQAFDRGLAEAANACSAWILTGGTDTGVMQLVAKALTRYEVKQPLIAIAPFGAVHGRDAFVDGSLGMQERSVVYATSEPAGASGAPLNPFHTHYVLVDKGAEGGRAWGTEQEMRARFEQDYAANKGVPQALLVVQVPRLASPCLAWPRLASSRLVSPRLSSPCLASPRLFSPCPSLACSRLASPCRHRSRRSSCREGRAPSTCCSRARGAARPS